MNLAVVIAQLRVRAPVFAQRVAGAARFEVLPEAANLLVPAAYVLPLDEQPGEQASQNTYQQTVREAFAVVVVLDNRVDERGQTAAVDLQAVRTVLFRALLGFQPAADHDIVQFEGGQVLAMDRARLYYQFEFSAAYDIGPADTWIDVRDSELPDFEGLDLDLDAIDPFDPNLVDPGERGPDGRIELAASIHLPQEP